MAEYKRLMLEHNGGILSQGEQIDANNDATILIGLGGTGVNCLRTLKRQIYQRVKMTQGDSSLGLYEHIKFLAVDADANSLGDESEDVGAISPTRGEYLPIAAPAGINKNREYFKWLRDDLAANGGDGTGAGGNRQNGRFLLMAHSDTFRNKVDQLIRRARMGLRAGHTVNIHIFSGMGGGTGSGTFLDACYIIRDVLKNNFQGVSTHVLGYFFLPDVNLSDSALDASTREYIQYNGFAAMKELDYCMNLARSGEVWDQQYRGFKVKTNSAPVDICHLISATTTTGVVVPNGYDYAMNVVSEFVMQLMTSTVADKGGFSAKSHIDNTENKLKLLKKAHGANHSYCILGASRAIMPRTEIATYLTSKLFAAMEQKSENVPTQEQIKTFLKNCGLDLPQLKQKLSAGAPGVIKIELGSKPYRNPAYKVEPGTADTVEGMLPDSITSPYTNKLSTYTSKLDENMPFLTLGWNPNLPDDKKTRSLVCKVMESLILCIRTSGQGPTYALNMLEGVLDSLNQIEIKLTSTESRANVQGVTLAKNGYLTAGFGYVGKKYDDLIDAVHTYYENKAKDDLDIALIKMVRELIKQFSELKTEYIERYKTMMDDLFATFKKNLEHLSSKNKVTIEDPFTKMIVTLKTLNDALDQEVAKKNVGQILSDFHTKFFGAYDQWQSSSNKNISEFVSNYFYKVFSIYVNSSMLQHLINQFGNDNDNLQTSVFDEIIQPLSAKASPLFSTTDTINYAGEMSYCLIPNVAPIQAATNILSAAGAGVQVIVDNNSDQILFISCRAGVPFFSYSELETYSKLYRGQNQPGTHLYEGEGSSNGNATDSRNWRELPNIIPYSLMEDDAKVRMAEESELYDRAVETNVIHNDGQGSQKSYYVCKTPDLKNKFSEIEGLLQTSLTIEPLQEQVAFLTKIVSGQVVVGEKLIIYNDGDPTMPETVLRVRKDNALSSKVIMGIIKEELEKKEKIDELLEKLNAKIEEIEMTAKIKGDFFNAFFTGVVYYDIPKIKYSFSGGIIGDISGELSAPPAQVPLYNAFLKYQQLDAPTRKKLDAVVTDRLGCGDMTVLKEACDNLKTVLTPQMIQAMTNMTKTMSPTERAHVLAFIQDFLDALQAFCVMYGI